MKTTTFAISILVTLTFCFWTCQSESVADHQPESHAPQKNSTSTIAVANTKGDGDRWPECRVTRDSRFENSPTPSHELKDSCATTFIEEYKDYADALKETLNRDHPSTFPDANEKLVYGAYVHRHELLEMIKKSSVRDSLFIMMGIMPDASTGLIFSIKSDSTGLWKFYDFTYPCPTSCPSFL